ARVGGAVRWAGDGAGTMAGGAETGALDGNTAPGAGVPNVRGERLAGVGGQSGSGVIRRSGGGCWAGVVGLCRLGTWGHPNRQQPKPPYRPDRGSRGAACGAD